MMEDDNARLQAKNNALRTKQAVNKAKEGILIAGGVVKKKKVKKKKAVKKAKAKAKAIPAASNLQAVMAAYAKNDAKLESKVVKMQAQIDAMKQSAVRSKAKAKRKIAKAKSKLKQALVPNKYHHIPYFKFSAATKKPKRVKTRRKCQEICDRQSKCKSYSWSIHTKV